MDVGPDERGAQRHRAQKAARPFVEPSSFTVGLVCVTKSSTGAYLDQNTPQLIFPSETVDVGRLEHIHFPSEKVVWVTNPLAYSANFQIILARAP